MPKQARAKKAPANTKAKKVKRAKAAPAAKAGTKANARKGAKAKKTARTSTAKARKTTTKANTNTKQGTVKAAKTTKRVSRTASTAKRASRNNTTAAATSQDPIQFVEEVRRIPKTYLTAKELREFKQLLLAKRAELCGDVQRLTDEALNNKGGGQGDHSAMPIHMADLGTDNWEQEFTLGLIANEQALVREIDDALSRIEDKTYGICLATHQQISKARLLAKPWAKYCIDYARAREEGRAS